MSQVSDTEQSGIRLVRPLLMDWCESADDFIDTHTMVRAEEYQRFAGDFIIRSKRSGKWFGTEVKTEQKWTGNFFAETYSNAVPNQYERDGWLVTLKTDQLVCVYLDAGVAVCVPFEPLKAWLLRDGNVARFPMRLPDREQRNKTIGHIVPYADLTEAKFAAISFHRWTDADGWQGCALADILARPRLANAV